MTYSQIESEMPNGLHDALLNELQIDYKHSRVCLSLDLLVGGPDDATEEEQEARKAATIQFTGLLACVVEPTKAPLDKLERLFIDGGAIPDPKVYPPAQFSVLPPGAFAMWMFLHDYNSFIYIAAHGASLTWQE